MDLKMIWIPDLSSQLRPSSYYSLGSLSSEGVPWLPCLPCFAGWRDGICHPNSDPRVTAVWDLTWPFQVVTSDPKLDRIQFEFRKLPLLPRT